MVDEIRRAMLEADVPNPYWSKDNKPRCHAQAACGANGVELLPSKQHE